MDPLFQSFVLVTNGKLEPCFANPRDHVLGPCVISGVVKGIGNAVPIDDNTIDARKLHQKDMTLEGVVVSGIVEADEGIVVGGGFAFAIPEDAVRVEVIHRPVPAPGAVDLRGAVPRQVMGEEEFGGFGGTNVCEPAEDEDEEEEKPAQTHVFKLIAEAAARQLKTCTVRLG